MTRYIAFLRAINVGGHTVKMAELKRLFEAQGFTHVETFIASGNVIFDAAVPANKVTALERRIEKHLHASLGYEVATFLRTTSELVHAAQYKAFDQSELDAGATLYVAFLKAALTDEAQRKIMLLKSDIEDLHHHQREIYWLYRRPLGESKITGAMLERAIGGPATVRNITTVTKMAAKYSVAPTPNPSRSAGGE